METPENTPDQPTPDSPFDSLMVYRGHIATLLENATHQIDWFDRDLADCDLRNPRNIAHLKRFLTLSPHNRLRILVHDGTFLSGQCARLLQLFDTYSLSISVRKTDETARHVDDAFLIVDESVLRRFQADWPRGVASRDPRTLTACAQRFEILWSHASPLSGWQRLHL